MSREVKPTGLPPPSRRLEFVREMRDLGREDLDADELL
jgi:hypothetical protein